MTDDFYKFCAQHSCREDCKNRSDYCPIADEVRSRYNGIPGGDKCEMVFRQKKEREG